MKHTLLKSLLVVSIIVAVAGFTADLINTNKYGGVDLRNRVVGARVLFELKEDPYSFKWSEGLSDRYLDPSDNAAIAVTRVTVTPTLLGFYAIFSAIPYRTQRMGWLFFQWGCLLGSVLLLAACAKTKDKRMIIWIISLLGVSGSYFWRLHVERGQIYIFYTFLVSLSYYLYQTYGERKKQENTSWRLAVSGLIIGILIALRPTFLFLLIPFFLYKRFVFVSYAAVALVVSVIGIELITPLPIWQTYADSIAVQGQMRTDETVNFVPMGVVEAEGIDIHDFLGVPGEDSSIQRILRAALDRWVSGTALLALLAVFLALASLGMLRWNIRQPSPSELFFLGAALAFFAGFFIAAPRWPYANAMWLFLIPLVIIFSKKEKWAGPFDAAVYALIFLGLLFGAGFHLIPHAQFIADISIPGALFLFAITIFLGHAKNKSLTPEHELARGKRSHL